MSSKFIKSPHAEASNDARSAGLRSLANDLPDGADDDPVESSSPVKDFAPKPRNFAAEYRSRRSADMAGCASASPAAKRRKLPEVEDVIKVQELGEENSGSYEYVVRVADIPGGLDEFLRQIELPYAEQQIYKKGVPVSRESVTHEQRMSEDVGNILFGLVVHKAIWTNTPIAGETKKNGYLTPANQRIVWAGPVFVGE